MGNCCWDEASPVLAKSSFIRAEAGADVLWWLLMEREHYERSNVGCGSESGELEEKTVEEARAQSSCRK